MSVRPDVCIVVTIDESDRILVIRRSAKNTKSGNWECPLGHRDSGESATEAAHREVAEETGLKVKLYPETFDKQSPDGKRIRVFLGRVQGSAKVTTNPTEHDAHRWVPWDELDSIDKCHDSFKTDVAKIIKLNGNATKEASMNNFQPQQGAFPPNPVGNQFSATFPYRRALPNRPNPLAQAKPVAPVSADASGVQQAMAKRGFASPGAGVAATRPLQRAPRASMTLPQSPAGLKQPSLPMPSVGEKLQPKPQRTSFQAQFDPSNPQYNAMRSPDPERLAAKRKPQYATLNRPFTVGQGPSGPVQGQISPGSTMITAAETGRSLQERKKDFDRMQALRAKGGSGVTILNNPSQAERQARMAAYKAKQQGLQQPAISPQAQAPAVSPQAQAPTSPQARRRFLSQGEAAQLMQTKAGSHCNMERSATGEGRKKYKVDPKTEAKGEAAFDSLDAYMKRAGLNSFQTAFFSRLVEAGMGEGQIQQAIKSAEEQFGEKVAVELTEGLEKVAFRPLIEIGKRSLPNVSKYFASRGAASQIPVQALGQSRDALSGLRHVANPHVVSGALTGGLNPHTGLFSEDPTVAGVLGSTAIGAAGGGLSRYGGAPFANAVRDIGNRATAGSQLGYTGTVGYNYFQNPENQVDPSIASKIGFGVGAALPGRVPFTNNMSTTSAVQNLDPLSLINRGARGAYQGGKNFIKNRTAQGQAAAAAKQMQQQTSAMRQSTPPPLPSGSRTITPSPTGSAPSPAPAPTRGSYVLPTIGGVSALGAGGYATHKISDAIRSAKPNEGQLVNELMNRPEVQNILGKANDVADAGSKLVNTGGDWLSNLSGAFQDPGQFFQKNQNWLIPLLLSGLGAGGGYMAGGGGGAALGGIGLPLLYMLAQNPELLNSMQAKGSQQESTQATGAQQPAPPTPEQVAKTQQLRDEIAHQKQMLLPNTNALINHVTNNE